MDLRRARIEDWLVGGFGLVLAGSLFLDWYGCAPARLGGGVGRAACRPDAAVSGWSALAVADVVMVAAGILAVAALVLTLLQRTPALPLALTSMGTVVALAAAVLAIVRLVDVPEVSGVIGTHPARLLGVWLAAGAALGLLVAMLASLRDERVPPAMRGTEGRDPEPRLLTLSGSASPSLASGTPRGTGGTP